MGVLLPQLFAAPCARRGCDLSGNHEATFAQGLAAPGRLSAEGNAVKKEQPTAGLRRGKSATRIARSARGIDQSINPA